MCKALNRQILVQKTRQIRQSGLLKSSVKIKKNNFKIISIVVKPKKLIQCTYFNWNNTVWNNKCTLAKDIMLWVLLSRTQKYNFLFLEPLELVLYDKNKSFHAKLFITQTIFLIYFQNRKFFFEKGTDEPLNWYK